MSLAGGGGRPTPITRGTLGFSLGAVGGARGTGAGAIRVLLQFVTQYDRGRLEELATDLKHLETERVQAAANLEASQKKLEAAELRVQRGKEATKKLDELSKVSYDQILKTQDQINDRVDRHLSVTKLRNQLEAQVTAFYNGQLEAQVKAGTLTRTQANGIREMLLNTNMLKSAQQDRNRLAQNLVGIEDQITSSQREQTSIQQVLSQGAMAIRSLVLGAAGAIIGGAVVGALLYEPLQQAVEKLKSAFGDLVGGADKAKAVMGDLATEIDKIASDKQVSRLEAAAQLLERINAPRTLAPEIAGTPDVQARQEQIDLLTKIGDYLNGHLALEKQLTREAALRNAVIQLQNQGLDQQARGLAAALELLKIPGVDALSQTVEQGIRGLTKFNPELQHMVDSFDESIGQLAGQLPDAAATSADALQKIADAWASFNAEQASAEIDNIFKQKIDQVKLTQDAAIERDRQIYEDTVAGINAQADEDVKRIGAAADARIARIQKQIQAVGDRGPSQTTQALTDQINTLNLAQERQQYNAQLADVAEQRHLILLRERLAATKEEIDLSRYQGKERLVAIDALLNRMQEQNAEQDRFNKLLDIQYQISQGVHRQQNETIADFIARRAQYYRGLIEQANSLTRQGPQAELEAERERTQTTLDLRALEARRTQIIRDREHQLYLRSLQDKLHASQENDRRQAEAERRALQDRITRIRANAQDEVAARNKAREDSIRIAGEVRDKLIAYDKQRYDHVIAGLEAQQAQTKYWTNKTELERLGILIDSASTITDLNRVSGALAGAQFSYSYMKAQLDALGVSAATQATLLAPFVKLLTQYQTRFDELSHPKINYTGNYIPRPGGYAEGGLVNLSNANMGNIRWGEQGGEGGVRLSQDQLYVLNTRIMNAIQQRDQTSSDRPLVGSVAWQSSGDFYRDRYAFRTEVRKIIREEMGR